MEQPIPRTEMPESEIMILLGLTWRREVGMRATMQQYLARWDARDGHVAETGPVRHLERWHFHHQYMDWYRTFIRWWISDNTIFCAIFTHIPHSLAWCFMPRT
ncbi:hypothetical protein LINGRAHAP2_LOCUS30813 [Linum grandiflorum]